MANIFVALISGAIVIFASASVATADHGALSAAEIMKVFAGAQTTGRTTSGANFENKINTDGTQSIEVDNGFSDTGKWFLEGDVFCSEWGKIRSGKKGCFDVRHLNGDKYLFKGRDGATNSTHTIIK